MEEKKNVPPLISVIIPVHNGQDYIEDCINSILAQTWHDLEVIIINDGSSDNTGRICEELCEKDKDDRLHLITLDDRGVSIARNAGIEQAKGEYITFVDADDRLLPGTIEKLYEIIQETGSDIAGCKFVPFFSWEEWEQLAGHSSDEKGKNVTVYRGKEYLSKGILDGDTRCWSKLYSQKAVGDLRFRENITIGEDMLFLLDLTLAGASFSGADFEGYAYYQNPQGAMNRPFTPRYMDQITCWELAALALAGEGEEIYNKVISILLVSIMLTLSKIALLSRKERAGYQNCIDRCRTKLKEHSANLKAGKLLPPGYSFKIRLFLLCPGVYMMLYHLRKYR